MDQIRTLHETSGSSIPAIHRPTINIVKPLLVANKESILTPTTKSYGAHPRQKLDIYLSDEETTKASPILIFVYGGGLVAGDKQVGLVPDGLVYRNLGTFFAKRGISTIIPDYRRVNSPMGGEDAVFPSGGEDLSLVCQWLESSNLVKGRKRDVFIMGNSAGGVHLTTFLLEPRFLDQRKALLAGENGLVWKGAVALGVPFHFARAEPERAGTLKAYFGNEEEVKQRCPHGLLEALLKKGISQREAEVPRVMVLVGEYDPEGEIGHPTEDFVALFKKTWADGVESKVLDGHNHISPPVFLMTRDVKGEEWAEDVAGWIKKLGG